MIEDADTHAVIGGGKARAFGIANTAEFVTVLSKTLYSNEKLAVAREILCNAWDAHIDAGITDRPVVITMTETEMRIRDFGKGIHDDMIGDIYCIYGESTKRKATGQTGGFGLGSKAPFAYSDHFTVTSHHAGKKTVYAVSRGSVETDGLPDLRAMVSVDSTETGIEVKIPIRTGRDFMIFKTYLEQVAYWGDMLVMINGGQCDTVGMDKADKGFIIHPFQSASVGNKFYYNSHSRIYIRYGTVIYPLEDKPEYSNLYSKLTKMIGWKDNGYSSSNVSPLVIQAPANSIAVAPSREQISYSESCVANIKDILEKVYMDLDKNYYWMWKQRAKKTVDDSLLGLELHDLANTHVCHIYQPQQDVIYTVRDMHDRLINFIRYGNQVKNYGQQYNRIMRSYPTAFRKMLKLGRWGEYHNFQFEKDWNQIRKYYYRILGPLYSGLRTYQSLASFKKGLYQDYFDNGYMGGSNPFRLIITKNMYALRAYKKGDYRFLVLMVDKDFDTTNLVAKLTKAGIEVDDITTDEDLNEPPARLPQAQRKARGKGYALLSACLVGGQRYDHALFESAARTETPDAVVYLRTKDGMKYVNGFRSTTLIQSLLVLYPNTVVVTSETTYHNVRAKYNLPGCHDLFSRKLKEFRIRSDFPAALARRAYANGIAQYEALAGNPKFNAQFEFDTIPQTCPEYEAVLNDDDSRYQMERTNLAQNYYRSLKNRGLLERPNMDLLSERVFKILNSPIASPEKDLAEDLILRVLKG